MREMCICLAHVATQVLWTPYKVWMYRYISYKGVCVYIYCNLLCILSIYKHLRLDFSICWCILIHVSSYIISFGCAVRGPRFCWICEQRELQTLLGVAYKKYHCSFFSVLSVQLERREAQINSSYPSVLLLPWVFGSIPYLEQILMTPVYLTSDSRKLHEISKSSVFCSMLMLRRKKWTNNYADGSRTFPWCPGI